MSERGDAAFRLTGRVTFDNLTEQRAAGEAALAAAGSRAVFDLSQLEGGNSAAVALLMAWFREADRLDKSIVFVGVPEELRNIIELSALTDVLPVEAGTAEAADAVQNLDASNP